jgi:hypothetical protein
VFDSSGTAQSKAHELGAVLAFQGVSVEIITINEYSDPGELPENVAEEIKKELLL